MVADVINYATGGFVLIFNAQLNIVGTSNKRNAAAANFSAIQVDVSKVSVRNNDEKIAIF